MYGQVVIGPPGSGKTTYCNGMQQYLRLLVRDCWVVNLDPANEVPHTTSNDNDNHDENDGGGVDDVNVERLDEPLTEKHHQQQNQQQQQRAPTAALAAGQVLVGHSLQGPAAGEHCEPTSDWVCFANGRE